MGWLEYLNRLANKIFCAILTCLNLVLLLAACTAVGQLPIPPTTLAVDLGQATSVGTTSALVRSETPIPVTGVTPTIFLVPSYIPSQISLKPTATIAPPPFQLCSPLYGWPLEKLPSLISDPYRPPPPGSDDRHQGIDLVYSRYVTGKHTIEGVVVTSVLPGRVAAAVRDSFPFGNLIIIETPREWLSSELVERLKVPEGESLYVMYAHLQAPLRAELGQTVVACYPLAYVGKSGNTDAAHLHLETRLGTAGATFPVMSAFREGTTPEERANYIRWRISWEFRHFNPLILLAPWDVPTPTPPRSD